MQRHGENEVVEVPEENREQDIGKHVLANGKTEHHPFTGLFSFTKTAPPENDPPVSLLQIITTQCGLPSLRKYGLE